MVCESLQVCHVCLSIHVFTPFLLGIRTEGILRHAGNQKRIETLQKLLDNGRVP